MVGSPATMLNQESWFRFGRAGTHTPNRLVLGDSLHALDTVANSSTNLVYIDPPFATGATKRGRQPDTHRYPDDETDPDRFVTWLTPTLVRCRDILHETGSLFVHLDFRTVHYVKVALDRIFGRNRFVNEIVWCYSVGGKSPKRFARKHDTILWYASGRDHAFYPQAVAIPRKPGSHMRVVTDDRGNQYQEKTERKTGKVYRYDIKHGKVPEDWWVDIETLNHSDGERTGWPTQKPEKLLERLVQAVTTTGDSLADVFAGSGTSAAVAQRLDRRFLGADKSSEAISTCRQRIVAAAQILAARGAPPPDLVVQTCASAHPSTHAHEDKSLH